MATAIGYIRVSTEGQAQDGVSLDAQRAKIEAWCALNDYTLAAVHVDAGISGKPADNRPGLQSVTRLANAHPGLEAQTGERGKNRWRGSLRLHAGG